MKLEEMILVTENREGIETNFLSSFEDYLKSVQELLSSEAYDVACAVVALFETKEKKEKWGEICFTSNHTYYVKFCRGERELRSFLQGDYKEKNSIDPFYFDEARCSTECRHVLVAYGMKAD